MVILFMKSWRIFNKVGGQGRWFVLSFTIDIYDQWILSWRHILVLQAQFRGAPAYIYLHIMKNDIYVMYIEISKK